MEAIREWKMLPKSEHPFRVISPWPDHLKDLSKSLTCPACNFQKPKRSRYFVHDFGRMELLHIMLTQPDTKIIFPCIETSPRRAGKNYMGMIIDDYFATLSNLKEWQDEKTKKALEGHEPQSMVPSSAYQLIEEHRNGNQRSNGTIDQGGRVLSMLPTSSHEGSRRLSQRSKGPSRYSKRKGSDFRSIFGRDN